MHNRLVDQFGNSIVIGSVKGKTDVITYRHTALSIIHGFYREHKSADEDDKTFRIISTAMRL